MDSLISVGGLASGLNTSAIISALVAFRSRPLDVLAKRQASFKTLKTRYESLKTKVDALQDAAKDIKVSKDFLAFTASSSKESVLSASASGSAAEGSYSFTVNKVAKAEVESSAGFADFTSPVGDGTLKVTYAGDQHDITIDPGSSLEDIAKEINNAKIGVTATVINTGVGATPFQITLTGNDTGTDNSISVDESSFVPVGGALGFTQSEGATNSSITFGGVTFERSSNKITDVIDGLTLDIKDLGTATVTVGSDGDAIAAKIEKYVKSHNDLVQFINSEIEISELTGVSGVFNGESTARKLKDRLLALNAPALEYPGADNPTLGSLGLQLDQDGSLVFDRADFDEAIAQNLDSVTTSLTKVGDFFADGGFQVVDVDDLAAGTYSVDITTAAAKANATAGAAFTGPLAQDEVLTINVGADDPVTVNLTAGTTLEDAIVDINAALKAAGSKLKASDDGGSIAFEAKEYGAEYNFSVSSDVASGGTGIGGSLSTATSNGVDVVGTINGEAATGVGQTLTADPGTTVEGASIKHTGDTAITTELTIGPDGFFQRVDDFLETYLKPIDGSLDLRIDGLGDSISDLQKQLESMELRVEKYKDLLTAQFANLESVIGKLQSAQSFLALNQAQLSGNSK